jgi:hypothetical protein
MKQIKMWMMMMMMMMMTNPRDETDSIQDVTIL